MASGTALMELLAIELSEQKRLAKQLVICASVLSNESVAMVGGQALLATPQFLGE